MTIREWIETITLAVVAYITLELALLTMIQAYRRWSWFWHPQTTPEFNGRWKLDWIMGFFLLILSIQEWLLLYNVWTNNITFSNSALTVYMIFALISFMVRLAITAEIMHRNKEDERE